MLQQRYTLFVRSLLRSVCVPLINMHKGRVRDVTHCYNLGEKCVPPCVTSAVSRLRHVGAAVVPQFETCGEKVCKLFNNYIASSTEDRRFCWFMYICVTYQAYSVKMAWYRPNCCWFVVFFFFLNFYWSRRSVVFLPRQSWCCYIVSHSSCNIHMQVSFLLYSYRRYSLAISNFSFTPCVSLIPACFGKQFLHLWAHEESPYICVLHACCRRMTDMIFQ